MPRSLLFTRDGVPDKLVMDQIDFQDNDNFIWTHLRVGDDIRKFLPIIVDRSHSFTEDLLEEQRPRIEKYQTLEDNDDTYSVIILSIPTNHIFQDDDFQLQVSFVMVSNRMYTMSSRENSIFSEIMSKSIAQKNQYSPTTFFIKVVSELMEHGIDVLQQIEEYIDYNERRIISGGLRRGWLATLLSLKGRLFDANKLVRADIEHINEIKKGIVPELDVDLIGDHFEDRALFLHDQIETQRENLANMINLYLAITSNLVNRQFYWLTIIGSLLIIPTVISSIWGMNINVPKIDFWVMMTLMSGSTLIASLLVKFFLPKPILE